MKFRYSDKLKSVFNALSEVRKSQRLLNVLDLSMGLSVLSIDLVCLYFALEQWIDAGLPTIMEGSVNEND